MSQSVISQDALDALRETLESEVSPTKYRNDPVGFVADAFDEVGDYKLLREIMRSMVDHKKTIVNSVNATGKSYYLEGAGSLWWYYTRGKLSQVIIVAPSGSQSTKLMSYVKELLENNHRKFDEGRTKIHIDGNVINDSIMKTSSGFIPIITRNPAANMKGGTLKGGHSRGGTLVFAEEASELRHRDWMTIQQTLLTGKNDRFMACTNPTDPTSDVIIEWKNAISEQKQKGSYYDPRNIKFHAYTISAFDTPSFTGEQVSCESMLENLVTPSRVEDIRENYGEESPEWNKYVLAIPDFDEEQRVIYPKWVKNAYSVDFTPDDGTRPVVGLDLATGMGKDETVAYAAWSGSYETKERMHTPECMNHDECDCPEKMVTKTASKVRWKGSMGDEGDQRVVASWLVSIAVSINAREIRYDGVAIGKPFRFALEDAIIRAGADMTIRAMMPQQSPADLLNGNKVRDAAAGWWWSAREMFKNGQIDLDEWDGDKREDRGGNKAVTLFDQLTNRSYTEDDNARVKLQSKKELRKSPDYADAFMFAVQSDDFVEYAANPPKGTSTTMQVHNEELQKSLVEEYSQARGLPTESFASRMHMMMGW